MEDIELGFVIITMVALAFWFRAYSGYKKGIVPK
jgi:hypothetical protein